MGYRIDSKYFDTSQYSLFSALWLPLTKPLKEKYNLQYSDFRILIAIDAFKQLVDFRLNGKGTAIRSIVVLTGFRLPQVRKRVDKMIERKLIIDDSKRQGARIRHNYKLTIQGKHIVNLISGDMERVHERIIDYLYEKKMLKH